MGHPAVVDCDVHHTAPADELRRYLSPKWAGYHERYGVPYYNASAYFQPRPRKLGMRADAWPPGHGLPGSDVEFMRLQLLEQSHVDVAILNCIDAAYIGVESAEYGAALTAALNDWTARQWLDVDQRFRASICVAPEHPRRAVAELERLAPDRRFIQVLLSTAMRDPLGSQKYWPLYEVAEARGLPIAVHVGGVATSPATGAGWPSYYFEQHSSYSAAAQSQIASLVLEGAFVRFPALKFVFQESGFAWLPALMWRLDAAWGLFGEDVSELLEPPSAYIRRGVFLTTQPIEGPEDGPDMARLLNDEALVGRLLYASDYPHWDFDSPDQALPADLGRAEAKAIMSGNAQALYGLFEPLTVRQAGSAR
jgi:predicted TIM-barrel fold metal-dependent hydrolase